MWEEELKDSPATTPGKPLKLAISLSHKYTEANLNFANLKGRDRMMADHLRSSGAFEVHLALIVREQEGGGEEDDYDDYEYGYYRGRGGNRRTSGFMTMVHVCNDEISVEKWVDETGETVENKGLEIDHEHETIDGEKLFHRELPLMMFAKVLAPSPFHLLNHPTSLLFTYFLGTFSPTYCKRHM